MQFEQVLEKYRRVSFSERDKGDRFERLMQAFLRTDPRYAPLFQHVWLWSEFPGRRDLGGRDVGVDLVAMTHDGDYWAIQCKCYDADARIDKSGVDSFLATSSREFMGEDLRTTRFARRLWISTTNRWTDNATEAIQNQYPPVNRLNLAELIEAPVDWHKLDEGIFGELSRTAKKSLYPHQQDAMDRAYAYFQEADRGKLIMACGTGKTFNALRIAENETGGKGTILVLVPSIALLGQTLREWSADAQDPIAAVAICSDPKVSRQRDPDSLGLVDLAFPASTDSESVLRQFRQIRSRPNKTGMTVVFSTYQSIDVLAQAQERLIRDGFGEFDLIVCDEAHRTTGVTLADEEESAFVKVHDNDFIRARKRLYMTATPRLYGDEAKSRAAEESAVLASMDDESIYGGEIYRIGFGEAVERGLLTDYKVLILTLNDRDLPPSIQKMIAGDQFEISTDDVSKLVGCVNALSKQFVGDNGQTKQADPAPMRRAVAFCQNIAASKEITATYNTATDVYLDALPPERKKEMVTVSARHMDGTMNAPVRDEMLQWLKAGGEGNECRVVTNVRVLSEGVDVPSLDAVMFLSARNSQVDVVQSVGRVMRRAPGKKYGYIIIPVVVPSDVPAEVALDDNERFRVVWTVLNALRAHDDRFNATVNKIELNRRRPDNILSGGPSVSFDGDGTPIERGGERTGDLHQQLAVQFEELQSVIFARMVKKVGDRRYWESWAKEVAQVAERQIERIEYLISQRAGQREAFDDFLAGLRRDINPSIDQGQAVEMLAQHIITQPIFEALFQGYSFAENNAVSKAMQAMMDALEGKTVAEESEALQQFYSSVKRRAEGIDNAEGKQRIIIELYDKFFETAFPRMVEQLGIVYTPVEVVDFIINSIDHLLRVEFERDLSDENIHVLDPFTGTGTFVTRLLQSGLIRAEDLLRKYRHELHANEIVLLAYYIAAVNIENAYHDLIEKDEAYQPFDGIVLTDTFQLGEGVGDWVSEAFTENSERVERQKKAPLRVIMGNPPYSAGQRSANDNAQNQSYGTLDARISQTYAAATDATNKNSLYDSYIRAYRWSTDHLDPEHGGIVAFVSNGAWLDGNTAAGFRKVIEREFSSIWAFNLRGNARTQGELRRREAGNVFRDGTRTPIAITFLVKNPQATGEKATIRHYDIGDYLSREEKLEIIGRFGSVASPDMGWEVIHPNEHGDWLNKRSDVFGDFIPLGDKGDKSNRATFFVPYYSNGLKTQRDAWCYNSSRDRLAENIQTHIDFYNAERVRLADAVTADPSLVPGSFLARDPRRISWTRATEHNALRNVPFAMDGDVVLAHYRPFFKQHLYFSRNLNEMMYQIPRLFPTATVENRVICVSGKGGNKKNTAIMTDTIPDLNLLDAGTQCFPLYYYEERERQQSGLFDVDGEVEYVRRDGVSDFILAQARERYGNRVTKEDIFYFVYGLLHSPQYREQFDSDLKKMLPRIPLLDDVRDFWALSRAGRALADLHIDYENVPAYPGVTVTGAESDFFLVKKMRYAKKPGDGGRKVDDKTVLHYNSKITISDIPAEAHEYVVNGRSALDWILDRYQVRVDKKSGIRNDPNAWAEEVGNPRYILDLILSVINVSVQTVEIVGELRKGSGGRYRAPVNLEKAT